MDGNSDLMGVARPNSQTPPGHAVDKKVGTAKIPRDVLSPNLYAQARIHPLITSSER